MSSTLRPNRPGAADYFPTPQWATEAIVPALKAILPPNPFVLEPAAGDGAMVEGSCMTELLRIAKPSALPNPIVTATVVSKQISR